MCFDSQGKLLLYYLTMPRVVSDQRTKFDSDEFLNTISKSMEVKYTGLMGATMEERRRLFMEDCMNGKLEIALIPTGFNLALQFPPPSTSFDEVSSSESPTSAPYSFSPDNHSEPKKVHLISHFILNGVCVRWKGWLELETLTGVGCVEFDSDRAEAENLILQDELSSWERQFSELHRATNLESQEGPSTRRNWTPPAISRYFGPE